MKLLTPIFLLVLLSQFVLAQSKYYVALNGNDKNPGTKALPFASLEGARDAIREVRTKKKNGLLQPINVFIRQGIYSRRIPFELQEEDGGSTKSPITYQAFPGESVTLHGGQFISHEAFESISDSSVLARLPEKARSYVKAINLVKLGITNYGKIVRQGFGSIKTSPMEVFFNKVPLNTSRYPNQGFLPIGRVNNKAAKDSSKGISFEVNDPHIRNWTNAKNIWIYGYFSNGWADDNLKLASVDPKSSTIWTTEPSSFKVYSSNDTSQLAGTLRGFYVYNLLEELDSAGEWYLDRDTGKLYIWPPESLDKGLLEVSLQDDPVISLNKTENITIKNLLIECGRGIGINIIGSNSCRVESCILRNLGTTAVNLNDKDNKGIEVVKCKIYQIGGTGVIMGGGDRKLLTPGMNKVDNCEIYKFGRIVRTYMPAVRIEGVGNIIQHSYFHDAYHCAILFKGNDHLIEYSHIENVCQYANDAGAVYTNRNLSERGTTIRYNYFNNITGKYGNSVAAIYLDDGTGGINVNSNIFYMAGTPGPLKLGTIFIHAGFDNICSNNIFIKCDLCFGNAPWSDKMWNQFVNSPEQKQRLFSEVNIYSKQYQIQYPEIKNIFDTTSRFHRQNFAENNIAYDCKNFSNGEYNQKSVWQTNQLIGLSRDKNGGFYIKNLANIQTNVPNFKMIPFKEIGLSK